MKKNLVTVLFVLAIMLCTMMTTPVVAQSIVVNGDFSSGNTGFSTGYDYVAPAPSALYPEGLYTVDTNPHNSHSDFCNMGDHTTGSGPMMIVNGDPNTATVVWEGTTNTDLTIGKSYDFEAWVTNVSPGSPAMLTFLADGATLGTITASGNCSWQRVSGRFTAGSLRPTLTLRNAQPAVGGNDFAIDDIDVTVPPEPEINVQRPAGTNLPDPSIDDLGNQLVGCGRSLTYTIENTGTSQLDVTSANGYNLTNVSGYSVVTSLPLHISPGGSATLTVNFCIDAPGAFNFDIDIISNDADEGQYDIDPQGTGITPEINVQRPVGTNLPDPSIDELGNQLVGCGRSLTYTIENTGTAQLDVTSANAFNLTNVSSYSVVTSLPLHIAPGGSATLTVNFCIDAIGVFNFDIDILSNDLDEGQYDIDPQGTGVTPEINVQRPAGTNLPDPSVDDLGDQVAGCGKSLTYTIENNGTAQLDVTSANAFNLTNVSTYTVVTPLPLNIAPGGITTLTVTFCIPDRGPFDFDIDIISNDLDEGVYDIDPEGIGISPEIDIQRPASTSIADGGTDEVGELHIGCDETIVYTIDNSAGTYQLDITEVSFANLVNCHNLSVASPELPFTVPTGGTLAMTLSLCIDGMAPYAFDMIVDNTDLDEDPYNIHVTGFGDYPDVDFCGQFDSDRNVGLSPVIVNLFTLRPLLEYNWNFGDGTKERPYHLYWDMNSRREEYYSVSLNDVIDRDFINVYPPSPSTYSHLQLVASSPSHQKEDWTNAIDGDIYWVNGTALVKDDTVSGDAVVKPWAIFEFTDQSIRTIDKLRLLTDTGYGTVNEVKEDLIYVPYWSAEVYNQVSRFTVYVSTTGVAAGDFTLLMEGEKTPMDTPCIIGDDWQEYPVMPTAAKYIKLVVDEPRAINCQLGEFEVYTQTKLAAAANSSIQSIGRAKADGVEKTPISLTLADVAGKPLTGKTHHDIKLFALPEYGYGLSEAVFDPIAETKTPGVYTSAVSSKQALVHLIRASVNGVIINKTMAGGTEVCRVLFGYEDLPIGKDEGKVGNALVFVTGTPTASGEGWDNAVDGDLEGWDGTATVRGEVDPNGLAWGLFRFADRNIYSFNAIRILRDNGTDDDGKYAERRISLVELMISTTGTNPGDFTSVGKFQPKGDDWNYHRLAKTVSAKYIKLLLLEPYIKGWRQIVEFEVAMNRGEAVPAADLAATSVAALPDMFSLEQNYPNPFNPVTTITYQLPEEAYVTLKVFDTTGREIMTLVNEQQTAGYKSASFNAAGLPSGLYFYTIKAGQHQDFKRMLLVK